MIKTFTPDDLLRQLYGETSPAEEVSVASQLSRDAQLQAAYAELAAAKAELDRLVPGPSERSLQTILAYSRSFATTG